ncbi:MAG: DUF5916 domain-containing protein [Rhodothermales bacterium]
MRYIILCFVLIFTVDASLLWAADDPVVRPSLLAYKTTETIRIDGVLDEASWKAASMATDFHQFEPVEGEPASQQTEVRILYSDSHVYIGAYLHDDEAGKILKTLGRRDDLNQADWFMVAIDSYHDRKTAYTFGVNAAGVQIDGINTDGSSFRISPLIFDTSWDAVWTSAVRVNDDGWGIEMRIPYSMLRFPEIKDQIWGINFRRVIPRNSETSEWSLVRREDYASGSVANYGTLEGLKNIKPRRNIQFTPYTVSGVSFEEGDAGRSVRSNNLDVGADLKLGITSNITLDATVNPDFGQVEADPAVLNLTVFENILDERRPFFVEGFQIFDYRFGFRDALLYTRRIGANAPIIGATKLSGRTDKGFSFGFLGALTGQNFTPTRLYSVGRVIQQIGHYSKVGAVLTAFDNTDPEEDDKRRSFTGGVDWDLRFDSNKYKVDGHFSFSNRFIPGEASSPEDTGLAAAIGFDKTRGAFTYGTGFEMMGDNFNPRDMGLLRRNDQFRLTAYVNNIVNAGKPFGPFQRGSVRLFHWNEWSYDRALYTGSGFFFFSSWLTKGSREFDLQIVNRDVFGGYDQFETRGLYPRASPYSLEIEVTALSDTRRSWQIGPQIAAEFNKNEGAEYSLGLEGLWNIGSRLSLETEIGFGIEQDRYAWASNEAFRRLDTGWQIGEEGLLEPDEISDTEFASFDDLGTLDAILAEADPFQEGSNDYYVPIYGNRNNRSIDLSLRSNITFTKDLSLQIFSQLFIARGKYDEFEILQNPDAISSFAAYPKQHDFSLNSFLLNTVFRWEFRPGSSIFLVWSQSRTNDVLLDPFNPNNIDLYGQETLDQINDVFGLFPTNVFQIKISYLIGS